MEPRGGRGQGGRQRHQKRCGNDHALTAEAVGNQSDKRRRHHHARGSGGHHQADGGGRGLEFAREQGQQGLRSVNREEGAEPGKHHGGGSGARARLWHGQMPSITPSGAGPWLAMSILCRSMAAGVWSVCAGMWLPAGGHVARCGRACGSLWAGMWLAAGGVWLAVAGHRPGRWQAMGLPHGNLLDWKSYGNSECEAVPALLPDLQR